MSNRRIAEGCFIAWALCWGAAVALLLIVQPLTEPAAAGVGSLGGNGGVMLGLGIFAWRHR